MQKNTSCCLILSKCLGIQGMTFEGANEKKSFFNTVLLSLNERCSKYQAISEIKQQQAMALAKATPICPLMSAKQCNALQDSCQKLQWRYSVILGNVLWLCLGIRALDCSTLSSSRDECSIHYTTFRSEIQGTNQHLNLSVPVSGT